MNTHRTLGFLAALVVTIAQIFLVSTSTAAVAQNSSDRSGYEIARNV
jgi:Ca2+/H+ antiporter